MRWGSLPFCSRIASRPWIAEPGKPYALGAAYTEIRTYPPGQGITSDHIIRLTSRHGRSKYPLPLRRVGFQDPETGKHYFFLTNHFHLAPKTIASIYKSRWQIELFFKWIKQHLKVKSFVGTSPNAVMTQLWIAMCIYLLLCYIKFLNRLSWNLHEILRLLQLNLFDRRPIAQLLAPDPQPPNPFPQLHLNLI